MTTITINLLVEEQMNQQAQARDPVKLGIMFGIFLVTLTVSAGMLLKYLAGNKKNAVAALQAKWDSVQTTQTSKSGTDTKTLQTLANDYLSVNQARSLFAPQLALLKDVIPDSIQLTQLRFAFVTEAAPAPPPPTGEVSAKAARAAKLAAKGTESLNLLLDGSVVSARPEIEIDQFIKTIRSNSAFSNLVKDVRLRSVVRVSSTDRPGAQFVVECVYKGKEQK